MPEISPCLKFLSALTFVLTTGSSSAQQLLFEFEGDSYRTTITGGADWDADGHADLLVGFTAAIGVNLDARVEARSGRDGSLLWQREAPSANSSSFGGIMALLGDVDGDGRRDVAVAAPYYGTAQLNFLGRVWLLSGADGAVLHVLKGASAGDRFGSSLASPGDMDGDGHADVLVGSVGHAEFTGMLQLVSGFDGQVLSTRLGVDPGDFFAANVAVLGDLDGDGLPEMAVSAAGSEPPGWPVDTNRGSVEILSGPQLQRVVSFTGPASAESFGKEVASVGDADGDGRPDLAVSYRQADQDWLGLYDSATLAFHGVVQGLPGPQVALLGDLDGDGRDEVVVGSATFGYKHPGRADVRTLLSGTWLQTATGDKPFDDLGDPVSAVGDVDADGIPDWAVGTELSFYARVYSGRQRPVHAIGGALAGAGSAPQLQLLGVPAVAETIVLEASHDRAGATAWLVAGSVAAKLPFLGGVLVPRPDVVIPLALGPEGSASLSGVIPAIAAGQIGIVQLWVSDDSAPQGLAASAALSVLVD